MKYINAEKVKAEIDKIIEGLKKSGNPNPLGTTEECLAAAEIEALVLVKDTIDKMEQEDPTPQGIEEEEKKNGWLDYGLTVGEIGLHRYNAIQRIKEHKDRFSPQDIRSGMLYDVGEYYEAVGSERTLCCLQVFCRDFRFTEENVRKIFSKED